MRTIKVKEKKSKYRLKADDGTYIGELLIQYDSLGQKCNIWIAKKGQSMTSLTIGRGWRWRFIVKWMESHLLSVVLIVRLESSMRNVRRNVREGVIIKEDSLYQETNFRKATNIESSTPKARTTSKDICPYREGDGAQSFCGLAKSQDYCNTLRVVARHFPCGGGFYQGCTHFLRKKKMMQNET